MLLRAEIPCKGSQKITQFLEKSDGKPWSIASIWQAKFCRSWRGVHSMLRWLTTEVRKITLTLFWRGIIEVFISWRGGSVSLQDFQTKRFQGKPGDLITPEGFSDIWRIEFNRDMALLFFTFADREIYWQCFVYKSSFFVHQSTRFIIIFTIDLHFLYSSVHRERANSIDTF